MSVKTPFVPEDVGQQELAAGRALAEHAVVGSHHHLHVCILHQLLESGKIGLVQVLHRRNGVEAVTYGLRTGMHGEMLGAGGGLQVERIISLDAFYIGGSERSGKERILSIGLHTAAPSGIPENVHVRSPESQSREAAVVLHFAGLVELGAAFVGDYVADPLHELGIECGSQADGLWKHGGAAVAGHSVESFVPPVVRLDAQPLHAGSAVHHHPYLLIQRHLRDQVGRLLVHRGLLGRLLGKCSCSQEKSCHDGQDQSFGFHNYLRRFTVTFASFSQYWMTPQ